MRENEAYAIRLAIRRSYMMFYLQRRNASFPIILHFTHQHADNFFISTEEQFIKQ